MQTLTSKGFTLVELLTTVAILGILASISLSLYGNYRTAAYDVESESIANSVKQALFSLSGLVDDLPVNNATNLAEVVASKSLNGTSLVYHNLTALGAASARVTQVLDATLWPIIKSPYLTLFFIYQPKGDVTVIEVKSCKGSFGSYTSMSGYVTQTRSGFYYYRNGTVETAQKIPGLSISGCEAAGF